MKLGGFFIRHLAVCVCLESDHQCNLRLFAEHPEQARRPEVTRAFAFDQCKVIASQNCMPLANPIEFVGQ